MFKYAESCNNNASKASSVAATPVQQPAVMAAAPLMSEIQKQKICFS